LKVGLSVHSPFSNSK